MHLSSSLTISSVVARRSSHRQGAVLAGEVALGSLRWAACMSFSHTGAALGSSRWSVRIGPYYGLAALGSLRGALVMRFSHECAPWQRQVARRPVAALQRRVPIFSVGGGRWPVASVAGPEFSDRLAFRRARLARVSAASRANPAVQGTWRIKPRQAPDLERWASWPQSWREL